MHWLLLTFLAILQWWLLWSISCNNSRVFDSKRGVLSRRGFLAYEISQITANVLVKSENLILSGRIPWIPGGSEADVGGAAAENPLCVMQGDKLADSE